MRRLFALVACALPLLCAGPPKTRIDGVRETLHGVEIVDSYRWLEDQEAPETRAWIDQQNQYTRSVLDALAGREVLRKRLLALAESETMSAPSIRGGRYFYTRQGANEERPRIYVRAGASGQETLLVDPSSVAPDVSVGTSGISEDGKLLAYNIRQGGKDEVRVRILDVDSRKLLPDELPEGRWFGVSFTPDKKRFFYATSGGANPRVREHVMGTPVSSDREIFGQGYGAQHILGGRVTDEGRYLILTVQRGAASSQTEVFLKDLASDEPAKPLIGGIRAAFNVTFAGGRLIARTNWNAPNWRVLAIDPLHPDQQDWKEIIPESRTAVLENVIPAGGKLVALYLEEVRSKLKVFSPEGKFDRDIELPSAGSVGFPQGRWRDPDLFYGFSSYHIPQQTMRYEIATGKQSVWFRRSLPIKTDDFEVNQVWYSSKDGVRVPMFLLHRKGLARDGQRPVLLGGYGGFNLAQRPGFSSTAVLWAEQGGVYAMPGLRGGSEFGEEWHKAGMLDRKQNVFDDFIAAAEYLVKERYTNPKKLAISGGSNGGLLVGAALTQRPDLYRAVICSYPLLDMVRYHKFLVARFWVPEYGSSEDPKQFAAIKAYSPYHHVTPDTKYPAVMIVTGDSDTRVAPLHGRKMAALLQTATTSAPDQPVLLHYDTKAGHSSGRPRSDVVSDQVDTLSFLFWQLGVKIN